MCGFFLGWKRIEEGNPNSDWNWFPKDVSQANALKMIQGEVTRLLTNIHGYRYKMSLQGRFNSQREYIAHDTEKAVSGLTDKLEALRNLAESA